MWDFTNEALTEVPLRQLALKLRPAVTAKSAHDQDFRSQELSMAQLNSQGASEPADLMFGESTEATNIGRTTSMDRGRLCQRWRG